MSLEQALLFHVLDGGCLRIEMRARINPSAAVQFPDLTFSGDSKNCDPTTLTRQFLIVAPTDRRKSRPNPRDLTPEPREKPTTGPKPRPSGLRATSKTGLC